MATELHIGDSLDVFRGVSGLASIVSDPPGGGHFMGLAFDKSRGGRDKWIPYWADRFRVAREATERGAWGLFWSFPRTAHWTACALDDAGWEVVSCIEHIHGQGWTKGRSQLKPAKEIWWLVRWGGVTPLQIDRCRVRRSDPIPMFAEQSGPRRVSTDRGTKQSQTGEYSNAGSWPPDLVLTHCPACKEVGSRKVRTGTAHEPTGQQSRGIYAPMGALGRTTGYAQDGTETVPAWACLAACECGLTALHPAGGSAGECPACGEERWWACPVAELDGQSGKSVSVGGRIGKKAQSAVTVGGFGTYEAGDPGFGDSGGASRFFPTFHYDAKASRAERQAGCDGLLWVRDKTAPIGWRRVTAEEHAATPETDRATGNVHATIKPVGAGTDDGLMRWQVRLITPPGGRVGDIALGSGSTAVACRIEGHDFVGCDIDPGAIDIARARCAFWTPEMHRHVLREAEALRRAVKRDKPAPVGDLGPLFKGVV